MKIQIGIGIVILVLAIAGIIWGVTTHREPGLMSVCWSQHTGTAIYDCKDGEQIRWQQAQLPLAVSTDGMIGETQTAIDLINSQVGCEILTYTVYNSVPDDIMIATEGVMDQSSSRGGITWHLIDGVRMRARVELYAPGELSQRVIVHELGHALGLAHDTYPASIMYPTQMDSTDLQFIRISDHDRSLLSDMYCN
jgi:hypothetical protein